LPGPIFLYYTVIQFSMGKIINSHLCVVDNRGVPILPIFLRSEVMKKEEKDLFDLFVKRLVTQGAGKNDNSIIGMIFIADTEKEVRARGEKR